jgi:hypothetical protein
MKLNMIFLLAGKRGVLLAGRIYTAALIALFTNGAVTMIAVNHRQKE